MKRQKHNLSNYKLATGDMGQLIPCQMLEILPGDSMQLETSALIRMSPMLAPVMHPAQVRFHHFFVPSRLLWDEWEDFITGGPDNDNASTPPQFTVPADAENGVLDYMGVPPVEGVSVNEMPLRAYNLIYNEYYRDQDLCDEREENDNTIAKVAWRKDYFTTARPWQQKGNDIVLPIGNTAPIRTNAATDIDLSIMKDDGQYWKMPSNNTFTRVGGAVGSEGDENTSLYADLSEATGMTATDFREFFALSRYAEARARYGSRYTEYLRYLVARS